jgi:hypothetical protein
MKIRGCLLAFFALPAWLGAVQETVYGSAGLAQPVDQAGVGARALAMGSAYVGVADDSTALMWNAAGLASLKSMDISLHHNSGLADAVQETLLFAGPLGGLGAFGAGFNYVNNGSFEGRDASGNLTSDFNAGSLGFQAGWGSAVTTGLSLGAALKASSQSLGGQTYSSFAGDVGGLWEPLLGVRLGLNYANIGTPVGGSTKANGLRLGASFNIPIDKDALLLAASTQLDPGGVNRVQVGAEGSLSSMFFLRAGYQINLAEQGFDGFSGATFGGGFSVSQLRLDYAYLPFGDLGASQRVSLAYEFGGPKPAEPKVESKQPAAKNSKPAKSASKKSDQKKTDKKPPKKKMDASKADNSNN